MIVRAKMSRTKRAPKPKAARKSPAKLVTMPEELWTQIDAAAGEGNRSPWLAQAARDRLASHAALAVADPLAPIVCTGVGEPLIEDERGVAVCPRCGEGFLGSPTRSTPPHAMQTDVQRLARLRLAGVEPLSIEQALRTIEGDR